jgi:chromosomal replication initiator protein
MHDKDIVAAALARLAERIGDDRFELWFGANVRVEARDSNLIVEVPNQFHQNWLRRNFRLDLEAACQEAIGRPLSLEFRVVAALDTRSKSGRNAPDDRQGRFEFQTQDDTGTLVLEKPLLPKKPTPHSAVTSGRQYATLESFVVGSSNRVAHAVAQTVSEQPGSTNPLFVYGPTGVGKTHLLEGILSAARQRHGSINAVYLTAEQFTTGFLEALRGQGLPNFRNKYRGVHLLVFDDLQFLAGKRATVVEFLHTFDTLVRQGKQLVIAADRSPAALHELGPELTTRLSGGMVAKIDPADHSTRLGIVRTRACAMGLELAADVEEFLATHLTAHARELTGALQQLLAIWRIRREPISRAIAEEALADRIQVHAKPVKFQEIERAVCDVFGLHPESLQGTRRAKALNAPRMLAMWLARKHTRAALSEIGQFFGRRSHSTVISAQKSMTQLVAERGELQLGDKTYNAEDAIRRVEAKLRAS